MSMALRVIDGGGGKKAEPKGKAEQFICNQCNGSAIIKVKLSPFVRNGRLEGGKWQWVCAYCFSNGKIYIVQ